MSKIYRYETNSDLYTIYSVNVTVTDFDEPTTEKERSKTFKFKQIYEAEEFVSNLWHNNFPESDEFFHQCLVVRTNIMRSGKLIK